MQHLPPAVWQRVGTHQDWICGITDVENLKAGPRAGPPTYWNVCQVANEPDSLVCIFGRGRSGEPANLRWCRYIENLKSPVCGQVSEVSSNQNIVGHSASTIRAHRSGVCTVTDIKDGPKPLSEDFAFFADAENFEHLTPPWLRFRIITPRPIEMRVGTIIDYKLRIHGFPVRWRSEITVWDPPSRFVDEQRRGPYRLWIHEHSFAADGDGTICCDYVQYAVWGGLVVQRFLVARDIQKIFKYRKCHLEDFFKKV